MSDVETYVEPWMRGPVPGVERLVMPVFHSFQMVREDLAKYTAGISDEAVWRKIGAIPTLGFQLRHIAGSVDRLMNYLMDEPLTPEQLAYLKSESTPGATLAELLAHIDATLAKAEDNLRRIHPNSIHDARGIGRKKLPTTVLGLLVHVAEHTQRHLGQAITTSKLVSSSSSV